MPDEDEHGPGASENGLITPRSIDEGESDLAEVQVEQCPTEWTSRGVDNKEEFPRRAASAVLKQSTAVLPPEWWCYLLVVAGGRLDLALQRPGVGQAPVQLRALLGHHRGQSAGAWTIPAGVALSQEVADLMVDEHLSVAGQIPRPLRRGRSPSFGG